MKAITELCRLKIEIGETFQVRIKSYYEPVPIETILELCLRYGMVWRGMLWYADMRTHTEIPKLNCWLTSSTTFYRNVMLFMKKYYNLRGTYLAMWEHVCSLVSREYILLSHKHFCLDSNEIKYHPLHAATERDYFIHFLLVVVFFIYIFQIQFLLFMSKS